MRKMQPVWTMKQLITFLKDFVSCTTDKNKIRLPKYTLLFNIR